MPNDQYNILCLQCGYPLSPDDKLCPQCGFLVAKTAEQPQKGGRGRKRKDKQALKLNLDDKLIFFLASRLMPSSFGFHTVAALYSIPLLAQPSDLPFGIESPSTLLFLHRFQSDMLDASIWDDLGVVWSEQWECSSLYSYDLVQWVNRRIFAEMVFLLMQKTREQGTPSVYEAKHPMMHFLLTAQQPLPPLTVVFQSGSMFEAVEISDTRHLAFALVASDIWPQEFVANMGLLPTS